MAAPSSTTRPISKSYRRQAIVWLMMTLLLGVATALVWMFSQTPAIGAKIANAPITAPQVLSSELEQPLSISALNELDTEVQPISFEDTVRDLRNYPEEFTDKSYLLANKGKWTVQVMNVAENEVIINYLAGREDRKKFAYFRYRDEDNQIRYMLTYGLMSSPQEAIGAAKLTDFGLPANVRVLPEEINRYVSIIDNYERPQPIKDLSTKRSRSVKLQPTQREVPVRKTQPVAPVEPSRPESSDSDKQAAEEKRNSEESIRQSADSSATLAVNEERTVVTDDANPAPPTKKEDKPAKANADSKSLPAVPAPKPPSNATTPDKKPSEKPAADKKTTNAESNTKNSNAGATKNSNDNIKELIEEKS